MSITIPSLAVPNFAVDAFALGDDDEMITKSVNHMTKLTSFANDMNAMVAAMNAVIKSLAAIGVYVYVGYANDMAGAGFATVFNNHSYVAFLTSVTPISPLTAANFGGKWQLFKGPTGSTGSTGATGAIGPKGDKGDPGQVKNILAGDGVRVDSSNPVSPVVAIDVPDRYVSSVDQATTSLTAVDINTLTALLEPNTTYEFTAYVVNQAAANTLPASFGIVVPANASLVGTGYQQRTSTSSEAISFDTSNVLKSFTAILASNTKSVAKLEGIISTGTTGGNLQLQYAAKNASYAVTIKAGSVLIVRKLP